MIKVLTINIKKSYIKIIFEKRFLCYAIYWKIQRYLELRTVWNMFYFLCLRYSSREMPAHQMLSINQCMVQLYLNRCYYMLFQSYLHTCLKEGMSEGMLCPIFTYFASLILYKTHVLISKRKKRKSKFSSLKRVV